MSKPHFQFFSAVYLIAFQDNKILLSRRYNTGWQDGMYTLPAGHIDGKETAETAMIREAKEEVNLEIDSSSLRVVHLLHRNSGDREYFDFFLEAKDWGGELNNNETDKCDDLTWFHMNELPENLLPYIRTVIERWQKGEVFSSVGFD